MFTNVSEYMQFPYVHFEMSVVEMAPKTVLGTFAIASISNASTGEEAVFAGCVGKS